MLDDVKLSERSNFLLFSILPFTRVRWVLVGSFRLKLGACKFLPDLHLQMLWIHFDYGTLVNSANGYSAFRDSALIWLAIWYSAFRHLELWYSAYWSSPGTNSADLIQQFVIQHFKTHPCVIQLIDMKHFGFQLLIIQHLKLHRSRNKHFVCITNPNERFMKPNACMRIKCMKHAY